MPAIEEEEMQHIRLARIVCCVLILVVALSACSRQQPPVPTSAPVAKAVPALVPTATPEPPTPTPEPTPTPVVVSALSDEEITKGIQASMDIFTFSLDTNNRKKINEIIDQENATWTKAMNQFLDEWGKYGLNTYKGASYVHLQFTVKEIKRKPNDFIMARVTSNTKTEMTWLFRYMDGVWKMSEPLPEQLGAQKTKDDGKFKIQYYEWDEPLLGRYEKMISTAYDAVLKRTGLPMKTQLLVSIWPTQETFPGQDILSLGGVLAKANPEKDTMYMRSLETFGAGSWAEGGQPDDEYLGTLIHEFTHIVHGHLVSLDDVPMWVSEGFAEYIAGHQADLALQNADRKGHLFGLQRLQKADNFGKLYVYISKNSEPFDYVYQAYNESENIVRYMVEKYGLDKFYALNKEYASSHDMDAAFKKVLGVSMAKFEQGWHAWLLG